MVCCFGSGLKKKKKRIAYTNNLDNELEYYRERTAEREQEVMQTHQELKAKNHELESLRAEVEAVSVSRRVTTEVVQTFRSVSVADPAGSALGPENKQVHVLLIIDVQNDFISGTLALNRCPAGQDGAAVVPVINELRASGHFDHVALSLDWHTQEHCSFHESVVGGVSPAPTHPSFGGQAATPQLFDSITLTAPDGVSPMQQVLWPRHCVQGTWGAELHPDLVTKESDLVVHKGTEPGIDSYSAFFDNMALKTTPLIGLLRERGATHVYCCGLATDVCVSATALDSVAHGFITTVVEDACAGVSPDAIAERKAFLAQAGVLIRSSSSVLDAPYRTKRDPSGHEASISPWSRLKGKWHISALPALVEGESRASFGSVVSAALSSSRPSVESAMAANASDTAPRSDTTIANPADVVAELQGDTPAEGGESSPAEPQK